MVLTKYFSAQTSIEARHETSHQIQIIIMAEKNENGQGNTRWWESYLVRYFLGFIIGAICVSIVAVATNVIPQSSGIFDNAAGAVEHGSKYGITTIIIAVSLLGLAYCYLASTPITVMHAGRYGSGPVDRLSRYFWLGWVLALTATLVGHKWLNKLIQIPAPTCWIATFLFFVWAVAFGFYLTKIQHSAKATGQLETAEQFDTQFAKDFGFAKLINATPFFALILLIPIIISSAFNSPLQTATFRMLVFGMPVLWIGFAQYFVLFRILKEPGQNYFFYRRLFAARRQKGAQDVRDTYTHLREHSNAIFIVAVELSLLSLILGLLELNKAQQATLPQPAESASFLLAAIGIWIVPTVFMWSRANAMERFFAERPDAFLAPEVDAAPIAHDVPALSSPASVKERTGKDASKVGITIIAVASVLMGLVRSAKSQRQPPKTP